MTIDLHSHTTRSDGTRSPAELVRTAAAAGTTVLAITDHDSVEGLEEGFDAAAGLAGFELVPGIELSADVAGGEVHVLGYFMDWHDPLFRERLAQMQDARVGRAHRIVAKLSELGAPITYLRVKEIAGDASIGRPHLAQALIEAGHVASYQEAFDRYLGRDGAAYTERDKTTPAEAVALIAGVGGAPVLAHPNDMGRIDSVDDLLDDLKAAGLVGMEVFYGSYPADIRRRLADRAARHGLIPCGGSDHHGRGNHFEGALGSPYAPPDSLRRLRTAARAGALP